MAARLALAAVGPRCSVAVRQLATQRGLWLRLGQCAAAASAAGAVRPARRGFSSSTVAQAAAAATATLSRDEVITSHPYNNVTDSIFQKIGVNLHQQPSHPLGILKGAIYDYFDAQHPGTFTKFDGLAPVVAAKANFDEILIPADHVSRSPNDTYYVDPDTVLRCHTSAHQAEILRQGVRAFLVTGDVYRRDSIDATHYPVFHQMEGVRVFNPDEWQAAGMEPTQFAEAELKRTLEGLAQHLFGAVEMRWVDAYFPFTDPSYELEIFFNGEWLEVLGCGVMQQPILDKNLGPGQKAWAFGLGLERLAMVLFDIPDIRLFWTADQRFLKQFKAGDLTTKFKSYSKYPPCYKDVAFWISDAFTENNLCEIVRSVAGDLAEEVKLIDNFTHPKTGRTSNCYRIAYRSMDRSLTDEEINALQEEVRSTIADKLKVELR
ncbi:hypothetical protein COHA_010161 [Chlorella ohadii]|uniref:phenylalanine--tRNA ligase n=1 Tax=Chlorella ohadii TaxID=2649997 RepID=A0AAD5DE99_9CHLO|nr:hypothetical protein COHA_010161 [Chlorella ohadii]